MIQLLPERYYTSTHLKQHLCANIVIQYPHGSETKWYETSDDLTIQVWDGKEYVDYDENKPLLRVLINKEGRTS